MSSFITILVVEFNVKIKQLSIFGTSFEGVTTDLLLTLLGLVTLYFLIAFTWSAIDEIRNWIIENTHIKEMAEEKKGKYHPYGHIKKAIEEFLETSDKTEEQIISHIRLYLKKYDDIIEKSDKFKKRTTLSEKIRINIFEFLLPLSMGVYAVIRLAMRIA